MDHRSERERIVVSETSLQDTVEEDIFSEMSKMWAETPNSEEISYTDQKPRQ